MKVLHVSGPSAGGISRHIQQLQRGLAAMDVKVNLVSPVAVRPGFVINVFRELKRGGYDLVHCHGYQGGAVGRAAAVLARVPAIVTIHNTLQVGGAANWCARRAESWLRPGTAWWVAVSNFLRNYAWSVLGVPDDRTEVIANGVDVPSEIPPWYDKPVVGIVARLIPAKGVDVFLRAIQLLRPEVPELQAVVVGDGPALAQLKALTHELGLEAVVQFRGHCEDVPGILKKMAVFVLPTRSEGLGISVMEAMAMGVPVVATAVGGVPELVRNNCTGILVRQDEYRSIARSVRELLENRERAENLRRAAYRHIADNYRTEAMLDQTLRLYQQVLHA